MRQLLPVIVCDSAETRKAQVQLPTNIRVDKLIQEIKDRWNLPSDVDYAIRLERTGQQLDSSIIVMELDLQDNDVLRIYPMVQGGMI